MKIFIEFIQFISSGLLLAFAIAVMSGLAMLLVFSPIYIMLNIHWVGILLYIVYPAFLILIIRYE